MKKTIQGKIFDKYNFIFWIFIIGSFLGFILENSRGLILGNHDLRQGLLYEPLIPIYGLGLLLFYLLYYKIKINRDYKILSFLKIFFIAFMVGSVIEYLCSYLQEKIFGTISWDYSKFYMNLNGRICLRFSLAWGICGILFYKFILPVFAYIKKVIDKPSVRIMTVILSLFLFVDVFLSTTACLRQFERSKNNNPRNSFEKFLDKKYPDEYINKIYTNAKLVRK